MWCYYWVILNALFEYSFRKAYYAFCFSPYVFVLALGRPLIHDARISFPDCWWWGGRGLLYIFVCLFDCRRMFAVSVA